MRNVRRPASSSLQIPASWPFYVTMIEYCGLSTWPLLARNNTMFLPSLSNFSSIYHMMQLLGFYMILGAMCTGVAKNGVFLWNIYLTFPLQVFHAFGHQWLCWIVYHPRKCIGFGLMDGESCEWFWSALKALIPSLHVSGVSWFSCYLFHNADPICHSITNTSSRLMLRLGILMQNCSTH